MLGAESSGDIRIHKRSSILTGLLKELVVIDANALAWAQTREADQVL